MMFENNLLHHFRNPARVLDPASFQDALSSSLPYQNIHMLNFSYFVLGAHPLFSYICTLKKV